MENFSARIKKLPTYDKVMKKYNQRQDYLRKGKPMDPANIPGINIATECTCPYCERKFPILTKVTALKALTFAPRITRSGKMNLKGVEPST